jgi:hypothetical protein
MEMKVCKQCNINLPLDDFYANKSMKDGYVNKCKTCTICGVNTYRINNLDKIKFYDKSRSNLPHRILARQQYQATDNGKLAYMKALRKYRAKYPNRYKARYTLEHALSAGKISKTACFECGCNKVEAHHVHYDLPLDVVWLCKKHHMQTHMEHNINYPIPFNPLGRKTRIKTYLMVTVRQNGMRP